MLFNNFLKGYLDISCKINLFKLVLPHLKSFFNNLKQRVFQDGKEQI